MIYFFNSLYIEKTLQLDGIIFKSRLDIDFHTILLGLIIYAISQVFIKGNELREENELTI